MPLSQSKASTIQDKETAGDLSVFGIGPKEDGSVYNSIDGGRMQAYEACTGVHGLRTPHLLNG
jgi:hypothetical protein